jgi:hypothetical protein
MPSRIDGRRDDDAPPSQQYYIRCLLLLLSPWKKINCYCSDDNDKKAHVTVLESISQCEGEEEWQMIAKSVVTLNT